MSKVKGQGDYIKVLTNKEIRQILKEEDKKNKNSHNKSK